MAVEDLLEQTEELQTMSLLIKLTRANTVTRTEHAIERHQGTATLPRAQTGWEVRMHFVNLLQRLRWNDGGRQH